MLGDEDKEGFAFGVHGMVLNLGLCIILLVVGTLKGGTWDYNGALEFLIGLAAAGFVFIVLVGLTDSEGYVRSSAEKYGTRLLLTKLFELIDTDGTKFLSLEEDLAMCRLMCDSNDKGYTYKGIRKW